MFKINQEQLLDLKMPDDQDLTVEFIKYDWRDIRSKDNKLYYVNYEKKVSDPQNKPT